MSRAQDVFVDGRTVIAHDHEALVLVGHLGRIRVTSGKLGACDPIVASRDPLPLARDVPPGEYPVEVAVLEFANGERRVGLARVQLAEREPVRWENAAPEGARADDLRPGEAFGYGVDDGIGCSADIVALRAFDECGEGASHELAEALGHAYEPTWSWADLACGDAGENVIAFSSGLGDGFYPSYWGFADDGELVCLVTDFGLCEMHWPGLQ
jgi:hypothetical protein